jgi:hypothetical protein
VSRQPKRAFRFKSGRLAVFRTKEFRRGFLSAPLVSASRVRFLRGKLPLRQFETRCPRHRVAPSGRIGTNVALGSDLCCRPGKTCGTMRPLGRQRSASFPTLSLAREAGNAADIHVKVPNVPLPQRSTVGATAGSSNAGGPRTEFSDARPARERLVHAG